MQMRFSFLSALLFSTFVSAQTDVVTNRYNQFSHGANLHESELSPVNVNPRTFGKLYSYYVDGAVYAQPLYVDHTLFVATMNDKIYAFDATKPGPPKWLRDLTNERAGFTPVPVSDITNSNDLNIVGNVGIEGTPVIDVASRAMYLVARAKENGNYFQRLYKLDLLTGNDLATPAIITAHVLGSAKDSRNGFVDFDPKAGNQRAALALVNGNVVIAWASHEDIRPYHGWIMAYDAEKLRQVDALCITPDMADGGIWQSGRGPAIDGAGALYFEVGNGGWDGKRNFGNSVIKVRLDGGHLAVESFYTPYDYQQQNETDADLGSSGPLLIPSTGVLVCGNKRGALFLLQASSLGGMTVSDQGVQQSVELKSGRVLAGPSYWDGSMGPALFIWNEAGVIEMLRFTDKLLNPVVAVRGKVVSHGSPGGALTVSSAGAKAGTGIVWATVGKNKSADHGNALEYYAHLMPKRWRNCGIAKRMPNAIVWGPW
jgi:outer membrane protein assembly factor BamB